MKRVLIPLLILAIILSVPYASQINQSPIEDIDLDRPEADITTLSAAGASGSNIVTLQYMSRALSGNQFGIFNSYTDSSHNGVIDLSSYQVSGWTLYAVDVSATGIAATAERVSLNVIKNNDIIIENDTLGSSLTTDALYQAFYNLPHDGKLENYSITYSSPYYQPSQLGYAFIVIRSDYASLSANETSFISPFIQTLSDTVVTHDVSADNAILNASTYYYTVIDGTGMTGQFAAGQWWFNKIFWRAEDSSTNPTGYHLWDDNNWYLYQGAFQREADLNYTYTPWNKTSGAPLTYPSAESISLNGNSTPLAGTTWSFSLGRNITQLTFQSNQSVIIDYNITLWYRENGIASTTWSAQTPGASVEWNATTTISYPALSGILVRFLDYTVQTDWTPIALYNGTNLVLGTHTKIGTTVTCTDMTDGTWRLSSSAPNYVGNIALSGVTKGKVSHLTDMTINATIEDSGKTPMTGGTTNLTVLRGISSVYSPAVIPASAGLASFFWDINATTWNGTHSIEVFWTNGLEAGYNLTEVFVYHPTTLVADDAFINAYTENSFGIGVNFDRNWTLMGLDGTYAAVTYSFDGGANTNLTDQTGGRWTATVSTAGKTDGTYLLYVYAEGFALENQSLMITVDLVFQTQALNISWSNTNDIEYLEYTNLSVTYRLMNDTRVAGATVTVTFQSQTYPMTWDPLTKTYWIALTGENFTGVPGTFNLNVTATRVGFESQTDNTITITIGSQTGEVFSVTYNPGTLNISYIETLFIQVTYDYNSSPIMSNTVVRVLFNGSAPVDLVYNATSLKWETTLLGSNYFGAWDIIVRATATGYTTRDDNRIFIVHEDIPFIDSDMPGYHVITDYDTSVAFSIFVTDSTGSPISDANVSFTAFGSFRFNTTGNGGEYAFSISPWTTPGHHVFTVTVERTGYTTRQLTLNITVNATTSISFEISSYDEYEQWDLTINVLYRDSEHLTPILDAVVNVTIDGTVYPCQYVGPFYQVNVTLDLAPGSYIMYASGSAQFANSETNQADLIVEAKDVVHIQIVFEPPQVVAGELMVVRATLINNATLDAVSGIDIHFAISIFYANGTVLTYDDASQMDRTNNEGIATYSFEIPEGQIESLSATATYDGEREIWGTSTTKTTGVTVGILSLLFSFLMSDIGLMIILSFVVLGIVAAAYNRGVKPKKKAAKRSLENQLHMFKDLETVQHFMAVYLDRGTCVFYHPFTEDRIQPDLISGFIAAITSVYGEIKGDGVRGTLEEIQYHGLRLNSYSGQYIIGILILEGEMTPLLRERLQFFVELFENQYDQDLDGWTGLVDCFDPEWVVSTLNSAFNYAWHLPHRFGPTQKVTKTDAKILDYIGAVRDDRSEFYIKDLLTPLAEMLEKTEAEVLDRLLFLQDRGVIVPIGIQTILQRQGLALVNGSEQPIAAPPLVVEEPTTVDEGPRPEEELQFDEFEEELVEESKAEVVEEPEPKEDAMESFVQDVESLLTEQAKTEEEEDIDEEEDELAKFAKELREKIGEDEDN
ncbi:MAG: hypothetical protein ACFFE1_15225 [Candidatus Thorarchaeota archaeon]